MTTTPAKIKFIADTAAFTKAIERMETRMKGLKSSGKKIAIIGASVAAAFAAIAKTINVFREQERAERQLEAAMRSTNATRGVSLKYLKDIASQFQEVSTFGDESGLRILQFGVRAGVSKDKLSRFLEATSDVTQALGTSEEAAESYAKQLELAFSKPAEAASVLRSMNIALTAAEQDRLKVLAETNNTAEAQEFILQKLEGRFGGMSREAAEGSGVWKQLGGVWSDFIEDIGGGISAILEPAARWLVSFFNDTINPFTDKLRSWGILTTTAIHGLFTDMAFGVQVAWAETVAAALGAASKLPFVGDKFKGMADNAVAEVGRIRDAWEEADYAIANAYADRIAAEEERQRRESKGGAPTIPGALTQTGTGTGTGTTATAEDKSPSALSRLQGGSSDDGEAAARAMFIARRAAAAKEKAAADAESQSRVDAIRYENETKSMALQMHLDGMSEKEIAFYERRRELEEEERLLREEERTAENEAELETLRIQKEALLAEEKAYQDESERNEIGHYKSLNTLLGEFGKKSGKLRKLHAVQNLATTVGELVAKTPAQAAEAYAETSKTFPFPIGPALGALHAGLIVANSAVAVSKAKGAISAQQGGIVPGSYTPGDSVPAFLQPGEMVVPIGKPFRNVEADIEARGAAKARAENNTAAETQKEIAVRVIDEGGLSSFIRAEIASEGRDYG